MIELLAKRFIPNYERKNDPVVRASYGTLISVTAIVFNVLLFAAKFLIGKAVSSVSITADAVNNLADAGSALLLLLGFRLANRKPDPDHPFGHGRIEYLAGLVVSVLIILTAWELGKSSVLKLIHPERLDFSWPAVIVLALAIGVKFYMSAFTGKTARALDSSAMMATAQDYKSDCISTAVVLACLLLFRFTGLNADGLGGLLVALLILKTGIESVKDTLAPLLGQKPDEELVARVEEIVLAFPEIIGVHDMVIHDYGPGRLHISLHAEVDGSDDIYVLHDAMDRAMLALDAKLGGESVIHMDPVDIHNAELMAL